MQTFDIVKKSEVKKSYRTEMVRNNFDLQADSIEEHFAGELNLPEKWQIGCIVGHSGTGKSTIAKHLFGDKIKSFEYDDKSVIDNMPQGLSFEEITRTFHSVGFSSVPSWLKPYHVLSEGEKMRVNLARAMLEDDFFVFDEFTSTVDRNVAQTCCMALSKAIRKKPDKRFIAVSCHMDFLEYLQPDWYFDTNKMETFFFEGERPQQNFQVRKCDRDAWRIFSRHHYLNSNLRKSAKCYGLYKGEEIIGFCGLITFPVSCYIRAVIRVSRIVILPDYQGIGLSVKFLKAVTDLYVKKYKVFLSCSARNMASALLKSKDWILIDAGKRKPSLRSRLSANIRIVNMYSFARR